MGKKIIVCQHVPYEPLGTLNPLIKDHGFRIRYYNFGRTPDLKPKLLNTAALIILGGPMHVNDTANHPHLDHEVEMIQEALRQQIPILGICLGAQLIAKSLGAKVQVNQKPEVGWHPIQLLSKDSILDGMSPNERVFQWHRDTFSLPSGATLLASSKACSHQAFRYGQQVYGFQFHLEVDEAMIQRWLDIPENKQDLSDLREETSASQILQDTSLYIQRLKQLSHQVFTRFLEQAGPCRRFRCPQSR